MAELGQPAYRTGQVWEWLARGADSFDEMSNLPAELRTQLAEKLPVSTLEVENSALSVDGTEKALFLTADQRPVEAVLMRYRDGRRSLCLSSQSGCPLTCTFCATGKMKFGRNLTESEILDQALHFRRIEEVNHTVFMGMGEPMMNLDNVLAACEKLPEIGIANSHTTISTVGWLPGHPAGDDRRAGRAPRPLAPRPERRTAVEDHAGQRQILDERGGRRGPRMAPHPQAQGLHRIPDARRCQRLQRTRPRTGRPAAAEERLQGQPDPVQPDRRGLPGLTA